jgi:hypothetical protein
MNYVMRHFIREIFKKCSPGNLVLPAAIVLFIFSVFVSCKKTGPADANIHVIDSMGKSVAGATVVLRQDTVKNANGVQANIYEKKTTDSGGNASFSFKWEAVLNVEIKKGLDSISDYIRLEQSKTIDKTFTLN